MEWMQEKSRISRARGRILRPRDTIDIYCAQYTISAVTQGHTVQFTSIRDRNVAGILLCLALEIFLV